jgi:DeoR family fructose operon transcriptional repressor
VFFDAGTTVLQLAKRLRVTPVPLTVFTNSLAVAEVLFGIEPVQLFMLGGRLRHENKCVVGPLAEQAIEGLWFDQLYLGASAVQSDNTVSTPDGEEARLNASMLKRSSEHFLLVDSSKFGRHATYRVAPLKEISHVFTDDALSEPWISRLRQLEVPATFATSQAAGVDES